MAPIHFADAFFDPECGVSALQIWILLATAQVRTISAFRILWSLETASDRAGSTHSPGPSAAKVSGIVDSGRILLWTLTIILVVLYMLMPELCLV